MSFPADDGSASWADFPAGELPRSGVRQDLPGIGGTVKQEIDDFVVEEIPAYEPCGEGEHVFLWIEKRDLSAEQLTRHMARLLGIAAHEIGMAGLKDRRAISRQYVSVPARFENRLDELQHDQLRVLRVRRHRNKLKRGHLRGNRFSILVRQTHPESLARAAEIASRVRAQGFANYYGSQRFGNDGSTLATGFGLLRGELAPRDLPPSRRRFLLSLSLAAAQSHLFNLVLADRIRDGLLYRVLLGDVMQVVATGGPFLVQDAEEEQRRCEAGETVVSGPLFGPRMLQPQGDPAEREARVLERELIRREMFDRFPKLTIGGRRPLLVRPQDLQIEQQPDGLLFRFSLPSGTYATSLLREFL